MGKYRYPEGQAPEALERKAAVLVASGDLRLSANLACWPAQRRLEADAKAAFAHLGWDLVREGPVRANASAGHGFIASQAEGRDVFARIHPQSPLVIPHTGELVGPMAGPRRRPQSSRLAYESGRPVFPALGRGLRGFRVQEKAQAVDDEENDRTRYVPRRAVRRRAGPGKGPKAGACPC